MTAWQARARTLADQLKNSGVVTDPAWYEAFTATPRHLFVPRFYALDAYNLPSRLVDGEDPAQHEEWLDALYADQPLVTQFTVAGVDEDGVEVRVPTSTASMPSVLAVMLDRLDLRDGHRVLEIGTGSGYNAALLCQRVGSENVVSVDIDPDLVAEAARRLKAAGHHPQLVAGDGAAGVPDAAPFDRIIATCGVRHIPPAWIEQLAPGGRIVTPLTGTTAGALAILDLYAPGEVRGHLDRRALHAVLLREGIDGVPRDSRFLTPSPPAVTGVGFRSLTSVDPRLVSAPAFSLWLELHLRDTHLSHTVDDSGEPDCLVLFSQEDSAYVRYEPVAEGTWAVTQYGRRRLWDTVEAAWRSWRRHGRPGRERLGVTAGTGPGEQYVWLDAPDSAVTWPLPL